MLFLFNLSTDVPTQKSGFTVTSGGYQTDYNYKDMNHFESLLEEEKLIKTWPRQPVCNFLLESEEKARKWTGLDKEDRMIIWEHLG